MLVRCQIDETRKWHFVCPGACWKSVSGGIMDGDEDHKFYRYGGMWKNKHEAVSAKKPKGVGKKKESSMQTAEGSAADDNRATENNTDTVDDSYADRNK